jgi:hypothetical protein
VEEQALVRAQSECLDDEELRIAARERAAEVRERVDNQYVKKFGEQILSQFPGCPPEEADGIASHACTKYSGRIGRSAAAKEFDAQAIELAVRAHIRHVHTGYDRLLSRGLERPDARSAVADDVSRIMKRWSSGQSEPECCD